MGSSKSVLGDSSEFKTSKMSRSVVTFPESDDDTEPERWDKIIHEKLQKSGQLTELSSEEEKEEMIHSLGDGDIFLRKYLNLEKHLNNELIKKLQEEVEFVSQTGVHGEKEAERMIESLLDYRRRATEFDVRLFFTPLNGLNTNNTVIGLVGRTYTYGPVHVGLEISGTPLHWNNNSLVSLVLDPTPLLAYSRVYLGRMRQDENIFDKVIKESKVSTIEQAESYYQRLVQMHYDTKQEEFMKLGKLAADKFQKVAQKCVWYNQKKDYGLLTCNCQHFVDDILKVMGIKFKPEDEFQLFMERIRKSDRNRDSFVYKDQIFGSRYIFDHYVDENWASETSQWNKRLLIQYSDLMHKMYLLSDKKDNNWGPMAKKKWDDRLESIF